ncbi:MAG: hypothetical protein H6Q68_1736 [Firmicutes bacterium]|nr:hypothetical protein [Bacillota bacterium]
MAVGEEGDVKAEEIFSIDKMPARVVHDLNQPLNSIKMISGGILYLLHQGKKLPDEELTECMKEIVCQTDKIANMLKKK